MSTLPHLDTLRYRLKDWEREKLTNANGLAHLADRTIEVLREMLKKAERKPGSADGEHHD